MEDLLEVEDLLHPLPLAQGYRRSPPTLCAPWSSRPAGMGTGTALRSRNVGRSATR